jgi:hypothetical protein
MLQEKNLTGSDGNTVMSYQNFLINGAFDFSQRYADTSISNIGSDKYTLDRWWTNSMNTVDVYVQRVAVTDLPGFRYALKIARTANTGLVGRVAQSFEYANVLPLQGKTVTLSFWYKTTGTRLTATYPLYGYDTATADVKEPIVGYANLPGYTPTTTWQRYSATFVVPATAKSFMISLMQSLTTGAGDVLLTGAMLNIGTSAAPFQRAGGTIGGELTLCQRYFEKSYEVNTPPGSAGGVAEDVFYINNLPSASRLTVHTQMYQVVKRAAVDGSKIGLWYGTNGGYGVTTNGRVSVGSGEGIPNTLYGTSDRGFNFRVDDPAPATTQRLGYNWAVDAEL